MGLISFYLNEMKRWGGMTYWISPRSNVLRNSRIVKEDSRFMVIKKKRRCAQPIEWCAFVNTVVFMFIY